MNTPTTRCRLTPLPQLATITVEGPDADAFLTAQLSRSLPSVADEHAPLAAWHDAKGRVQGLFTVVRPAADTFWLVTSADAAADIVGELGRFVLRSRVTLRVAGDELECVALSGACAAVLASVSDTLVVVRIGPELAYAIGQPATLAPLRDSVPGGDTAAVELAEIRLGLPRIGARLRGEFLPQMLDLDGLGAVEFDKGCYPGQEIIARTQNLGTVKRRLRRFVCAACTRAPEPGDAVVDSAGARVGRVVRAARVRDDVEMLAVVDVAALTGSLRCETPEPCAIELVPQD